MIIKSKQFKNFTVIDNTILKEQKLSLKAKGLFCILCSLPSDWKIRQSQLPQYSNDSGTATSAAFKELIQYGIVKVINRSGDSKGWRGNYSYIVYPNLEMAKKDIDLHLHKSDFSDIELNDELKENNSQVENSENLPLVENPLMEKPLMGNPLLENPLLENRPLLNKEYTNKEITNKEITNKIKTYSTFVEIFYDWFKLRNGFPPKINSVEGKAMKQIILYLNEITKDETKSIQSWQYILQNWDKLPNFYINRMRLIDISSSIVNILIELKQNKNSVSSGKINQAYNDTMNKLLNQRQNGTN